MKEADLRKKFNIASRYSEHTPDKTQRPWLSQMVGNVLKNSEHIFFGEPHVNGNALKVYEMLAQNPALFETAAAGGVKHLALEFPSMLQKYVDQYAEGKMTRAQLQYNIFENPRARFMSPWVAGDAEKQFASNFIQTIDNAISAGIQVHLADVSWQVVLATPPRELRELQTDMMKQHRAEKSKLSAEDYLPVYMASLPEEKRDSIEKAMNAYQQKIMRDRLDDTAQFEHLRESIAPGERMMGVVGLGHLDNGLGNQRGINHLLRAEGERVTTVEIYDKRDTRDFTNALQEEVRGIKNRELPDYTIIMGEDAVFDRAMKPVDAAQINSRPPVPRDKWPKPPKLAA